MKYLELTIGAILVYNFVLARFLGICPFLGVSKRLGTAMGMSGAVVFVMTIASFITSLIYRYLLKFEIDGTPYDLSFLQVLLFILVIAGLVQLIEIMLQKLSPKLYQALGIYLPLITTNCAVLGAATINADLFLPLLFISSFSPLSFKPLRLQTTKKRRPFNAPCFYYKGSVRISQAHEDILSYIFMTFCTVFIKMGATQSGKMSKTKNTRRQSAGGNEKLKVRTSRSK